MKQIKIKKIQKDNRKKQFNVFCTSNTQYIFPYSKLKIKPHLKNPIYKVFPDRECGNLAFTYILKDKSEDTIPLSAIFNYNQDFEYMRKKRLYHLTCKAQKVLKKKNISKSELARRMKSSPLQVGRLLNQTFYGKTTDQMIKLLKALDCEVHIRLTA